MGGGLEDLADRLAITDLLYRYAAALDDRDWALLATCFTPAAVAIYGGRAGTNEGFPAIEATCRRSLEPLDASQHIVTNPQVTVEGDAARSRCYLQAQHVKRGTEGGDNFTVAGSYLDRLVRTPDGWRIAERRLEVTWVDGNPTVLGWA